MSFRICITAFIFCVTSWCWLKKGPFLFAYFPTLLSAPHLRQWSTSHRKWLFQIYGTEVQCCQVLLLPAWRHAWSYSHFGVELHASCHCYSDNYTGNVELIGQLRLLLSQSSGKAICWLVYPMSLLLVMSQTCWHHSEAMVDPAANTTGETHILIQCHFGPDLYSISQMCHLGVTCLLKRGMSQVKKMVSCTRGRTQKGTLATSWGLSMAFFQRILSQGTKSSLRNQKLICS